MIFGAVTLIYEKGTLAITKKNTQIVRHYVGTDINDNFNLGKGHTSITCKLIAKTEEEKVAIEALLHSETERELHFDNYFYKDVVPSSEFTLEKVLDEFWLIGVEFIALDPIPYDEVSEEALY